MLQGFTGQHPQKVDGKGRMSVPAAFRRVLEAQDPAWSDGLPVKLHINYNPRLKQHLRVYSVTSMSAVMESIERLTSGSKLHRALSRTYLNFTDEVTMDKDGRIVLPQRLREKMGVAADAELSLAGMGQYFEIWQAAVFDAEVDAELDAFFGDLDDDVDPLSLIPAALAAGE